MGDSWAMRLGASSPPAAAATAASSPSASHVSAAIAQAAPLASGPLRPAAGEVLYHGGCHCGAVRFDVSVAAGPAGHRVLDCNCSMCTKKGFLHLVASQQQFALRSGQDKLTLYTFNTHKAKHLFCSVCGICSFYRPRSHPSSYSVNLLALDDYALLKQRGVFAVEPYDGRNWESARGALAQTESSLGLDAMAADAEGANTAARPAASSAISPAAAASATASAARGGLVQNGIVSYAAASSTTSAANTPASASTATARTGAFSASSARDAGAEVDVIRVGVLCVRKERSAGVGTYSPGLEHDAKLYERALTSGLFRPAAAPASAPAAGASTATGAAPVAAPASTAPLSADDWPTLGGAGSPAASMARSPPLPAPAAAAASSGPLVRFEIVQISPRWDAEGAASAETLRAIQEGQLDAVLALEELGGPDMIAALRGLKGHHLAGGSGGGSGAVSACVGGCTPQSHSSLPSYSSGPACCPLPSPTPPPHSRHPVPAVVWVPNCEVLDPNPRGRWRPTLECLHTGVVDVVLGKMPRLHEFLPCISGVFRAWGGAAASAAAGGNDEAAVENALASLVVHCPHTCWVEGEGDGDAAATASPSVSASASPSSVSSPAAPSPLAPEPQPVAAEVPPEHRRIILHFAGSSPHKNTLENSRAGLELVRALNAEQALAHERATAHALATGTASPLPPPPEPFTFVVFICSWPASRRKEKPSSSPRYSLGPGVVEALSAMATAHPREFRLVSGGFMSYAERAGLYAQTRLALCCSRAEGYGHYILEAAAAGALVVTTDGAPMSSVLSVPGSFALALPDSPPRLQNFGVAYSVPAGAIVAAARTLPILESEGYSGDVVSRCKANESRAREAFSAGMGRLKQRVVDLVWRNRAAARLDQGQTQILTPVPSQVQQQQQQRRALPHTLPAFFTEGVVISPVSTTAAPAPSPLPAAGAPLPRGSPPPPGFGWAPAASPLALALALPPQPGASPPPGFGLSSGQSPRLAPQGSPPGFGPLHLPRSVGSVSPSSGPQQPQQSPPSGSWAAASFQQPRATGGISAHLAGFPPLSSPPPVAAPAPAPAPAWGSHAQSSPVHAQSAALPVAAFSLADFEAQLLSRAKAQQQQQQQPR